MEQKDKKVLAIIPARAGSKRIKNKNKLKLAGKELVRYAIESALSAYLISTIAVNSDDEDILAIARGYEKIHSLRRPKSISGDRAKAITYVEHTLEKLEDSFDFVVIIQPTSPFTTGKDIDSTIKLLVENDADSAVSVVKLDHAIHPVKLKKMKNLELVPFLEEEQGRMAAHELSELYVRNCSVYASTMQTIREGLIIGEKCLGYLMPRERSIDINDPIDFEFAEFLLNRKLARDN